MYLEVTDPQDKVFGLLGLLGALTNEFIDYKRNLKEVLLVVAIVGLEKIFLQFLCYVEAVIHADDIPSWVPKWRNPGYHFIPLALFLPTPKNPKEQETSNFSINEDLVSCSKRIFCPRVSSLLFQA